MSAQTGSTAVAAPTASAGKKAAVLKTTASKSVPKSKSSPTKKVAARGAKASSAHPAYIKMITSALRELKERGGSSRQAILKHICSKHNIEDSKHVQSRLKVALKRGLEKGALKQNKGSGASGSFSVNAEVKKAVVKAKKATVKTTSPSKAGAAAKLKKPKATITKKATVMKKVTKKPAAAGTGTTSVKKTSVTKKKTVAAKVTKPATKKSVPAKSATSTKPVVAKKAAPKPKKVAVKKTGAK